MKHRTLLAFLATFTALGLSPLSAARAAESAPALALLTYSGDQSALEAVDREIIAAGRDATQLAKVRDSLLAVLRHRDATFEIGRAHV